MRVDKVDPNVPQLGYRFYSEEKLSKEKLQAGEKSLITIVIIITGMLAVAAILGFAINMFKG